MRLNFASWFTDRTVKLMTTGFFTRHRQRRASNTDMRPSAATAWARLCIASTAAVLTLATGVLAYGILPAERELREAILSRGSPAVTQLAEWANYGGSWPILVPVMLMLVGVSAEARRRWWLWGAMLGAGGILEESGKFLIGRPRPESDAFGFPSGHATAAAIVSIIALYVVSRTGLTRGRRLLACSLALSPMWAVGVARVVLRAHWPADVAAGLALGTACAAAAVWWHVSHPVATATRDPEAVQPGGLSWLATRPANRRPRPP